MICFWKAGIREMFSSRVNRGLTFLSQLFCLSNGAGWLTSLRLAT
jgi:hypothetical protein